MRAKPKVSIYRALPIPLRVLAPVAARLRYIYQSQVAFGPGMCSSAEVGIVFFR
jgi:hypothetical protein